MDCSENKIDSQFTEDEDKNMRPKVIEAKKCDRKKKVLLSSFLLLFILVVLLILKFALKGKKMIFH